MATAAVVPALLIGGAPGGRVERGLREPSGCVRDLGWSYLRSLLLRWNFIGGGIHAFLGYHECSIGSSASSASSLRFLMQDFSGGRTMSLKRNVP